MGPHIPTVITLFKRSGLDDIFSDKIELFEIDSDDARNNAQIILSNFGGRSVGESGPGAECAASVINFYEKFNGSQSAMVADWDILVGPLIAFASTDDEHAYFFVNDKGMIYIFTDPDEKLYACGNFLNAISRVLLGYRWDGKELKKPN